MEFRTKMISPTEVSYQVKNGEEVTEGIVEVIFKFQANAEKFVFMVTDHATYSFYTHITSSNLEDATAMLTNELILYPELAIPDHLKAFQNAPQKIKELVKKSLQYGLPSVTRIGITKDEEKDLKKYIRKENLHFHLTFHPNELQTTGLTPLLFNFI